LGTDDLAVYAAICGKTLAMAHPRSEDTMKGGGVHGRWTRCRGSGGGVQPV
jgi:hypothetical protein